jgi:putative nucleotidyltransferase with HDIG domain
VQVLHQTIPQFSLYAMGVSTSVLAILLCFLVQPQLALVSVPLLAAAALITLKLDPGVLVLMLTTGFLGYFFSMRRQDMDNIIKAGAAISGCGIVLIAALHLTHFVSIKSFLVDTLLFGAANGLLTAVLATGLLPLFERVFNVITPHRLLELSNPENPLLKQLLTTAPGTYHHCIFVGNLAETAAEAVGADPLLVRIACYYHDVGKLRRPYFFAENQLHGQNPLDDKSPSMGALIIYQHVKEGVEMLREHKLPEPIIRIASEHHGTCLISFFYQQARSQAKDPDTVSEERFRYPGPTPSTLESAIVMLCDGCEAAVRSLKDHAMRNIENTVNAIVKGRLVDGQFDHCNITLQQIDTVRKTLIETLARIYHARVEYPDEEELKKKFQADHVPGDRRSGKAS